MSFFDKVRMLSGGLINRQFEPLVAEIEKVFNDRPPTIAIIGTSGSGKSSTINSMFGTALPVSATVRGTKEFSESKVQLKIERGPKLGSPAFLRVYDAPGLGEDLDLDPVYIDMYEDRLPDCDVALWVIPARNRALALDQSYLKSLSKFAGKIVVGLSQVDLVDPVGWDRSKNMPTKEQIVNIEEIVADREIRLSKMIGKEVKAVAYSSLHFYRLMELFEHIILAAPKSRKWMFDAVRSFDATDWLRQVDGMPEEEKKRIIESYKPIA